MNKDLKQGQRVQFCIGELKGKGKIVGKALTDQPIIGGTYIIEPDIPIRNEVYDYTHFVAQEIQLLLIDEKITDVSNASFIEQDIEKVCGDCCDDYTVDINNQYIGKVFQWLINNDYIICKKVDN